MVEGVLAQPRGEPQASSGVAASYWNRPVSVIESGVQAHRRARRSSRRRSHRSAPPPARRCSRRPGPRARIVPQPVVGPVVVDPDQLARGGRRPDRAPRADRRRRSRTSPSRRARRERPAGRRAARAPAAPSAHRGADRGGLVRERADHLACRARRRWCASPSIEPERVGVGVDVARDRDDGRPSRRTSAAALEAGQGPSGSSPGDACSQELVDPLARRQHLVLLERGARA